MLISFFEEFPTTENLRKLQLVKWPTKLYVAANSKSEFHAIASRAKKIESRNHRIKEFVYWPILERREGYWISPFSGRQALERVFSELKDAVIPVMLDLELPTTRNPWLYLTQAWNFFHNRRMIRTFIESYQGTLYAAEYYPTGKWKEKVFALAGIHYTSPRLHVIKMLYHSMHRFDEEFVHQELKRGKETWGNRFIIGLGTIAPGVMGNEPLLTVEQLKRDLELCSEAGISEVVIFRLGGLNEEYAKVLKGFVQRK